MMSRSSPVGRCSLKIVTNHWHQIQYNGVIKTCPSHWHLSIAARDTQAKVGARLGPVVAPSGLLADRHQGKLRRC